MIALKRQMQSIHQDRTGRVLVLMSAGRFDQQVTTKFHRDGGPDECFLMLGYEPSGVSAEVSVADFSRCAFDMGLTPAAFLDKHNPMFTAGELLLRPYTTSVRCFSSSHSQVFFINNSVAPYSEAGGSWQGVLHTATVHNLSNALRRVVNSTLVASVPRGTQEPVSEAEQEDFMTTTVLRRRGHDKQYLEDDP